MKLYSACIFEPISILFGRNVTEKVSNNKPINLLTFRRHFSPTDIKIISHAGGHRRGVGMAFSCVCVSVCLSVCLFVRTLKLSTPKTAYL